MIRRTFQHDGGQVLVTYDHGTDEVIVGMRENPWDEWSRPLAHIASEDDAPGLGRHYGAPGNAEMVEHMRAIVAAHDEQAKAAESTPDPGD